MLVEMAEQGRSLDELLPLARNFSQTLAERVRGQEGVPMHLRRKRAIEELIRAALAALRAARCTNAGGGTLEAQANKLDLGPLNALIERHNRHYPIEANLPIDPRTGGSLDAGRPWRPMPLVTPPDLIAWLDG
jgi:hypothetical protein